MAVPDFNPTGCLPVGTHLSTIDEFETRFGGPSLERRDLMGVFRSAYQASIAAGLNRIVVGGSFVTAKASPLDLDGILLGDSSADWPHLHSYVSRTPGSDRRGRRLDLFPATDIATLTPLIEFLSLRRDGTRAGVVEIPVLVPAGIRQLRDRGLSEEPPGLRVLVENNIDDELLAIQIEKVRSAIGASTGLANEGLRVLLEILERRKAENSVAEFYEHCLRAEITMPGPSGIGDLQINSLVGLLTLHSGYGCGQGRLAVELATLDANLLARLTYIGLDFDPLRADPTLTSSGLRDRAQAVELADYAQAHRWKGFADFVMIVNVLHEVPCSGIASMLSQALGLVKEGGHLVLHDMEHLVSGERGFVPWLGEEVMSIFENTGLVVGLRKHLSRRGLPLYTLHVRASQSVYLDKEEIRRRTKRVLALIEERLVRERQQPTALSNSRLYGYLSVAIANTREQALSCE